MSVRVGLLVAGGVGILAAGFAAGRAWRGSAFAATEVVVLNDEWHRMPGGPIARYEPAAVVVGDKLYAFGGFMNRRIQATPKVDVWDAANHSWSSRRDMPIPTTHWMPSHVGDTLWFAGGFTGDHPGPGTDRVWAYDLTHDTWHEGPSLPAVRGSGVLVVVDSALHYIGGYGADRQHAVPEHWRLDLRALGAGRTWQPRAGLPRPRGHASSVVLGGYIYLIGGAIRHDPVQIDVAMVDRYDIAKDRWEVVADLPRARSHNEAATFTRNGLIYMAGGRSLPTGIRSVGDIVVYDPEVNQWFFDRRLPVGLLAPVVMPIGDTLVLGLGATEGTVLDAADFWTSPLEWGWREGTPSPVPAGEVAAAVIGRRIFLLGQTADSSTPVYDIGTDSWEILRGRRPALGHHHTAETANGLLYLFGGLGGGSPGIVQIFDPVRGDWRFGADMPFHAGSSASTMIDGIMYVGGGIDGDHTIADAARYDPVADRWATIAPMPLPRNHAASGTDGQRWYVFGGRGPGSGDGNSVANGFAEVQVYDPAKDQWIVSGRDASAPAPLPQGRGGMGRAVFVDGEFWVIGGETEDGPGATSDGVYGRIDIFDPTANSWRRGPDLQTPRHGIFPVAVGSRIYVAGGGIKRGRSASGMIEIFDTAIRRDGVSVTRSLP